ncbi:MAG: ester cyclase [Halobaculum sp.]
MTDRDPDRLVATWFDDLFGHGDYEVLDELVTESVDYHGPQNIAPGETSGRDAIEDYVAVYRRAFPDISYEVEEVVAADGVVTARWSLQGTLESDLFGVESSGEVVTGHGISVFHLSDDGKFAEIWSQWDTLSLAQELDIVPAVE